MKQYDCPSGVTDLAHNFLEQDSAPVEAPSHADDINPSTTMPSVSQDDAASEDELFFSDSEVGDSTQQPHDDSAKATVVISSVKQDHLKTLDVGPSRFDVGRTEDIPEPIFSVLSKWYQGGKKRNRPVPQGAVCRTSVEKARWCPSVNRRPQFQDSEGRERHAKLYSLKKWTRNGKSLILVLRNDFREPVVVKGPVHPKSKQMQNRQDVSRLPCKVWKRSAGEEVDNKGFEKTSSVFLVGYGEEGKEAKDNAPALTQEDATQPVQESDTGKACDGSVTASAHLRGPPPTPEECLCHLPAQSRNMLIKYYTEQGTLNPPICASLASEERIPMNAGDTFAFTNCHSWQVSVDCLPTGYADYVFLVAEGKIIKGTGSGLNPREYSVWAGGQDFSGQGKFYRNLPASTIEIAAFPAPEKHRKSSRPTAAAASPHPFRTTPQGGKETTLPSKVVDPEVSSLKRTTKKQESSAPDIKASPDYFIDLSDVQEHGPSTIAQHEAKRQKTFHRNVSIDDTKMPSGQTFTSKSRRAANDVVRRPSLEYIKSVQNASPLNTTRAIQQRSSFQSRRPGTVSSSKVRSTLTAHPVTHSQIRSHQPTSALPLLHQSSSNVEAYIRNHVVLHFVRLNNSISRDRSLDICDTVNRLFTQATLAFGWTSREARILIAHIPGLERPFMIAEKDDKDHADFMNAVRGARDWERQRESGRERKQGNDGGDKLVIDVEEMGEE
jgi:hypothetical protein